MERSIWDFPVTDKELEQHYGADYKPQPHDAACNAIRSIHYAYFEKETAQAIIAVLAEKLMSSDFTKHCESAHELLDLAFAELDKK